MMYTESKQDDVNRVKTSNNSVDSYDRVKLPKFNKKTPVQKFYQLKAILPEVSSIGSFCCKACNVSAS
jgi:hypothetical protein